MRQVLPISDIFPFENRLRFFSLPDVRLIGKTMRHTNGTDVTPIPLFWNEYYTRYHDLARALPQMIRTTLAWIGEYDPITQQYTYMICVICPAQTPVPDGFEFRDVPAMLLGHGTVSEHPPDAHNIERFAQAVSEAGFIQGDAWCEFYPDQNKHDCCILFAVKPME